MPFFIKVNLLIMTIWVCTSKTSIDASDMNYSYDTSCYVPFDLHMYDRVMTQWFEVYSNFEHMVVPCT